MFSHLHNHFTGSFSDSALRIDEGVKKAKQMGHEALAITEHGEMPFVYEFCDACRENGIKPIIGVEIYFVDDARKAIETKNNNRYHLLLFAKNETGYRNMVSLVSESWTEYNYNEKRGLVDWGLLEKYREGLIGSTACFFNHISQAYIKNNPEDADKIFARYKEIFGGDFYAEIGKHGIADEETSNKGLLELAKKYGIKPISTNDVHYLEIDDWVAHDMIIKTRFEKISSFKAESHDFWLKSESEMLYSGHKQQYLDNTQEIVEKCAFDLTDAPAAKYTEVENPDAAVKAGDAAFASDIEYIDREKATYYAEQIIGKNHPDVKYYADRIAGIPRKLTPDINKIVYLKDIKRHIPLKVSAGKIISQFSEKSCVRAGASVQTVARSPLSEALLGAKKVIDKIFE